MMKLRVAFIYFKLFPGENAAGDLCIFAKLLQTNCIRKGNRIRREDEGDMREERAREVTNGKELNTVK